MASPYGLASIAYATETSFGVAPSTFFRMPYAGGIEFVPQNEMLPLDTLRSHPYADDFYIGPSRASTLRFKVPLFAHSTAAPGGTYLSVMLLNVLGGVMSGPSPKAKTNAAIAASYSPELATYITAAPHMLAWSPDGSSPYQGRIVTAKSGSYGLLLGKTIDTAGATVVSDASGSCNFGYVLGQITSTQKYSSTLSFEIAGPTNDDAYILTGCAGAAKISADANGIAFAEFDFRVYSWTRTTRDALDHTSGTDSIPVAEHSHGDPVKMTYSTASWHKFVTDQHDDDPIALDVLGFSLDLGVSPKEIPAITYDNGIGGWFRESSNPTLSLTTYFNEALYDRFEAQVAEQPLYIQIGAAANRSATICFPNAQLTQMPARSDSSGQLAMTLNFAAKHSITMPSGSPEQSTVWIGFF